MTEKTARWWDSILERGKAPVSVFFVLEASALAAVVYSITVSDWKCVAISAATLLFFAVPLLAERLFSIRFSGAMLILCMCFFAGPLLGHVFKLYYVFAPWDKLLHTLSGVIIGGIGYALPSLADRGNSSHSALLKRLCAACLALSTAAAWEFFEFGMERLFGMDMQLDTVVHSIDSYLLGGNTGTSRAIDGIRSVTVNGVELGLGGYVDIGLIDTMTDMLVCALGCAGLIAASLFRGGRPVQWALPRLIARRLPAQEGPKEAR